jgi:1-acyl-sn-glycerol-3-phosphate acyltransferase
VAQVIPITDARTHRESARCRATTAAGRRCRNRSIGESGFCRVHLPEAPERIGPFRSETVRDALEFLRRRVTGDYEIDEFGLDSDLTERVFLRLAKPIGKYYWRVDWRGLENIPAEGAALLVANHAGTLPVDAVVMKFGVLEEHPARRHVRLLAADLAFRTPFTGPLARKMGSTLATPEDAYRMLDKGELVGVFPEGYKGVGKGWEERYKLQRFGRGGFIELALRARVPLIPVAIVGSEEIYPMIGNSKLLAKMLGFPYFPITPTFPWLGPLGMIPLPSKWIVEFGEPIETSDYGPDAWQDSMLVFEMTDRVRDQIQQMLYRNVVARRSAFF